MAKSTFCWCIVETRRVSGRRVVQRQVLSLGELNACQEAAWCKTVALFERDPYQPFQVALFDENHALTGLFGGDVTVVAIRLSSMRLLRLRQWGVCWLG